MSATSWVSQPGTSGSRQPLWIMSAILALMGLVFLAMNLENNFVLKTDQMTKHESHPQSSPMMIEKLVTQENIKVKFVESVDRNIAYTSHDYDKTTVHVVYSTSCDQPNRQFLSSGLQISASKIGHRGPITEIISGCNEEQIVQVNGEPTFYYDYHRHFSPNYSKHPEPGVEDDYTPYNKPYSLRHLLETASAPIGVKGNMPVALVDADFFFFQPLRVNTGKNITAHYHGKRQNEVILDTVEDGHALAQDWTPYYGAGWFGPGNKDKKDSICLGKPCMKVSSEDGKEHYAGTGPPYILTKNDWLKIIDDYGKFVIAGRKLSTDWMVEMYAYGLAAGNNGIKHTIVDNLGITWPKVERNAWNFLDEEMENPCDDQSLDIIMPSNPPVMFHYCQKYGFLDQDDQGWHFYKYHIPYDILKCDAMLLQLPPPTQWTDISSLDLTGWELQSKRHEVWAECTLAKIMNQVFITTKEKLCPFGYNTHRGLPMNEPHKRDSALPGGVPFVLKNP